MTRTMELEVDTYTRVGPYTNAYGHGPVTIIGGGRDTQMMVGICLDCGFISDDIRAFQHEDCDPGQNPINKSWREHFNENGFPDGG